MVRLPLRVDHQAASTKRLVALDVDPVRDGHEQSDAATTLFAPLRPTGTRLAIERCQRGGRRTRLGGWRSEGKRF
jgi:hypothetical protein